MVEFIVFLVAVIVLGIPLGSFMAKVFEGERHFLIMLRPVENLFYRVTLINGKRPMTGREYTGALFSFSFISLIVLFLMMVLQKSLPLNPQNLDGISWTLAVNTAISFVTNTNWQAYSGESTLSYLVQSLGLVVQNFLSAGVGLAVLVAMLRGIKYQQQKYIGNFWQDLIRGTLYILLPLALIWSILLLNEGVVQNFSGYIKAFTVEGAEQILPMGPIASQVAIKQLGSNGGGFFGVNSAHPFENPTAFSNFLQMLAILLIPCASIFMFGRMLDAKRHAWGLIFVCLSFLIAAFFIAYNAEQNWLFNLEGKELRFMLSDSISWALSTTATSNGSVNAMHDSLSPLAGGIALLQILLGEVIFGGVGSGLYGLLLMVVLTVFFAGLMIGRAPEYLGKKIETYEIKMALFAIMAPAATVLIGVLMAVLTLPLTDFINAGPHAFTELLYAFASAANNNGSAMGSLNVNTSFFNIILGVAMLIGRFFVIASVLAIAQSLSQKSVTPKSSGTLSVDDPIVFILLFFVIMVIGALTFMPALMLGPVVEHFLLGLGRVF